MGFRRVISLVVPCYLLVLVPVAFIAGCSGSDSKQFPSTGEAALVDKLVVRASADWMNEESFNSLFASGSELSDKQRKAFQGKSILVQPGGIQIDGNNATIQVVCATYSDGAPIETELTWEAVKEGDQWKLTKAPLP